MLVMLSVVDRQNGILSGYAYVTVTATAFVLGLLQPVGLLLEHKVRVVAAPPTWLMLYHLAVTDGDSWRLL